MTLRRQSSSTLAEAANDKRLNVHAQPAQFMSDGGRYCLGGFHALRSWMEFDLQL
jgi:hypothetical protein